MNLTGIIWLKYLCLLGIILCAKVATSQVSYNEAFTNLSFNFPVEIQHSNDNTNRLFVVEQPGTIKVFPNTADITSGEVNTFLDISSKVAYSAGQEIGLLGLAFHPNFETNRHVYVYYIDNPGYYRINISRFTASESNGNYIDPSTETLIASFTKNQAGSNHNGGKIAFGPDGYLYISVGDGGGAGDPMKNAQNLDNVFGSILRIDVDLNGDNPIETNPELPDGNYEIPSDNPLVDQNGLDELFAWGIRNTWKFSFDTNGELWGADVGQGVYEEINIIENGGNYGWNRFEAFSEPSYGSGTTLASSPDIKPIYYYDHSNGDVSITGGYHYSGSLVSAELQDKYIYADYVSGRVWALDYNSTNGTANSNLLFQTNGQYVSSFGEDQNGELYFSDYGPSAKIYKLTETSTGPVTIPVDGVGNWENIAQGTNGAIETISVSDEQTIYIGGSFTIAGNVMVSNLAQYSQENGWQSFGTGTNGTVYSIAVAANGYVYVGGDFTQINGISANNVAYWDGNSWNALGTGTNGPIAKIALDPDGNLLAGGVFSTANGITANNIALWNGTTWVGLTDSGTNITGTNNEIRSLDFDSDGNLYVGGNFDTAGGVNTPRIAKWDGANWSALGDGTSGFVQAILATDDYIYVGGNFALAGGTTVNRVAKWNRTSNNWEPLDFGVSGNVNALVHDGNFLYVGGTFETASELADTNETMNNIARWSETDGWEALGTDTNVGVDTRINSLHFKETGSELIAGGIFSVSGNTDANNISIWSETTCNDESVIPEYQIDGEWDSGSAILTLEEGTSLVLSMLPNNVDYTITAPDGNTTNGDLDLGTITNPDAGIYVLITETGCSTTLELSVTSTTVEDSDGDGVPDSEDECSNTENGVEVDSFGCEIIPEDVDADGDGVLDESDLCPNTPANANVDNYGCVLPDIPTDNFTIASIGANCANLSNGKINISATQNLNYTATVSSDDLSLTETFTNSLEIEDLTSGIYEICITVEEYPDYQYCSSLVITEPEPLSVYTFLNEEVLTLNLSGSDSFIVEHNDNKFTTSSKEVKLKLKDGTNSIKISTDIACQGEYTNQITQPTSAAIYPNPFKNGFKIDPIGFEDGRIDIAIHSFSGEVLFVEKKNATNDGIYIEQPNLATGIYVLILRQGTHRQTFKLVKK